jgi:hypothetical protein
VRAGYRDRPPRTVVPTVADVLRAVKPAKRPQISDDSTQRFRDLLRAGLTAADAMARIEAEKGEPT